MSPSLAEVQEFHYRLRARVPGLRPGGHHGASLGNGQQFAAHRRLFDQPDPRRLDLRASLRDPRGDWLVRIQRQRTAVPVHAVVDVSASMHFGSSRTKLEVAADFVEALGRSVSRAGDALGLLAFDAVERDDLCMPPRQSRGLGGVMAGMLRACRPQEAGASSIDGLRRCLARLAGRPGLVFIVSDFHWPTDTLGTVLDMLAPACVVPMIAWDPGETEPPAATAMLAVSDAESGMRRTLWLREAVRVRWREAVAARRAELHALFEAHGMAAFHLHGRFDAEALSRHFLESVA
ncbi:VWA domain-containing protein [Piscinibacter sp. XHJ-5]|uniref:DUF58 domain-containing protein n=1 Tax=Piscinibacter sp. XHJ-5 TaxID=3037797 RepID=UPI002452FC96|nr:VWA domain-containing protein [Piscinibacter sp. XHJ-5]